MVDASKATLGDYLNADLVQALKVKQAKIIDAGEYQQTDFGEKLTLKVETDLGTKKWRPNKDSAKNLSAAFSNDTTKWLNKIIHFKVLTIQGKTSVVGFPE